MAWAPVLCLFLPTLLRPEAAPPLIARAQQPISFCLLKSTHFEVHGTGLDLQADPQGVTYVCGGESRFNKTINSSFWE